MKKTIFTLSGSLLYKLSHIRLLTEESSLQNLIEHCIFNKNFLTRAQPTVRALPLFPAAFGALEERALSFCPARKLA